MAMHEGGRAPNYRCDKCGKPMERWIEPCSRDDEPPAHLRVEDATTVELLQAAWDRADELFRDATSASTQSAWAGTAAPEQLRAVAREAALAKTHTEDAIMRYNRAQAEIRGTRRDYDFERETGLIRST